ncbi:MAG: anhydro-N-acetylmuramic acid kinase [Bacteroidetes bacterium]|jgi:anhydro-N-acetylmuramic acid kinase|nr:anhydro-N-acetylmuramic acid kinase [Bacteroidota bacterium]
MHAALKKLVQTAEKPTRNIIGLMSGTSLDGLDIAFCEIKSFGKQTQVVLKHFETVPYDDPFKNAVREVFSKKNIDLERLCLLHPWIGEKHAEMVLYCLKKWQIPSDAVDLIASHGQTVYHAPKRLHQQIDFPNATLQIGDGDHLAVKTGITTLSDFRQKHLAAGGEGAPLAAYGDYLIFSDPNVSRILINIGGIANFTFLPKNASFQDVFCTDTGPGNTLMDAYVQKHVPNLSCDKDAAIAATGKINPLLLQALKKNPFFRQNFPKTIGPELFNLAYLEKAQAQSGTSKLPIADVLATLNRFSAETLAEAISQSMNDTNFEMYVSGGGIYNPLLLKHLQDIFAKRNLQTTAALGIHPDAKEAVLFAVLANECICNPGNEVKRGHTPDIRMGKISFPT